MLRINSPFVTQAITQKKIHSSVIVDIVFNKTKKKNQLKNYSFDVSTINDNKTHRGECEEWEMRKGPQTGGPKKSNISLCVCVYLCYLHDELGVFLLCGMVRFQQLSCCINLCRNIGFAAGEHRPCGMLFCRLRTTMQACVPTSYNNTHCDSLHIAAGISSYGASFEEEEEKKKALDFKT